MDLSFESFRLECEGLATEIRAPGTNYDRILCVARGGLFVGGLLAHLLEIRNIATIAIRHYMGAERLKDIEVLCPPCPLPMEGKTLLVDDLIDSGETVKHMVDNYARDIDFDIAVLYDKGGGNIRPTYFVDTVPKEEWITFPWEVTGD